jgi:hypothetical protein
MLQVGERIPIFSFSIVFTFGFVFEFFEEFESALIDDKREEIRTVDKRACRRLGCI